MPHTTPEKVAPEVEEWKIEFDEALKDKHREDEVYTDAGFGCMECGGGLREDFVKSFITTLTTKHQKEIEKAVEEERQRCAEVFADNVLDMRDETGAPLQREIKLNAVLQTLTSTKNDN